MRPDDPKRIERLRRGGVPEDVIRYATNPHRVWVGPLRGITVNGERCPTPDEKREVVAQAVADREAFQRRVAAARARFGRRV